MTSRRHLFWLAFDRAANTLILRRRTQDDIRYMRSPPMGARDETTTSYLHYTYSDRCLVAVGWSGLLPQRAKRRGKKSPGKRAPAKRKAQTARSATNPAQPTHPANMIMSKGQGRGRMQCRKKNRCADEDVSSILDTEYSYPEYKPCWYYNNHGYCEKGTACSFEQPGQAGTLVTAKYYFTIAQLHVR